MTIGRVAVQESNKSTRSFRLRQPLMDVGTSRLQNARGESLPYYNSPKNLPTCVMIVLLHCKRFSAVMRTVKHGNHDVPSDDIPLLFNAFIPSVRTYHNIIFLIYFTLGRLCHYKQVVHPNPHNFIRVATATKKFHTPHNLFVAGSTSLTTHPVLPLNIAEH